MRLENTLMLGLPWGVGGSIAHLFTEGTFYILPGILCGGIGLAADGFAAWRGRRA